MICRDTEKKPELKHDFYVVESMEPVAAGMYKMKISFAGQVRIVNRGPWHIMQLPNLINY